MFMFASAMPESLMGALGKIHIGQPLHDQDAQGAARDGQAEPAALSAAGHGRHAGWLGRGTTPAAVAGHHLADAHAGVGFPPHFSRCSTLATPARAHASSWGWLEPELPTPPITSLPT